MVIWILPPPPPEGDQFPKFIMEFLTLIGDSLQYLRWYTAVKSVHYEVVDLINRDLQGNGIENG